MGTANADLTETAIPRRRVFTRPGGSINFLACLRAAKDFRSEIEGYLSRRWAKITPDDLSDIGADVRDLVRAENERWAAMPPALLDAATWFDSILDLMGTDCICDPSRREAIVAIASGKPAVWDSYQRSPKNPFVAMLNIGATRQCYDDSQATVFDALVAFPNDSVIDTLRPLNKAGDALIRSARAARAMRGRPVAA